LEARELKTVHLSSIHSFIHPSLHPVVGAAGSLFWPNEEDEEEEEEDEEVEKKNKSSAKCLLL
jgi:CO dehydrogenase/acetyl-CoA synthase beta subunit